MKDVLTRFHLFGVQAFWWIVILLVLIAGTTSIVLPLHYAKAQKRQEPTVTIHPKNTFSRTLEVVGDVDYKPFSYLVDESDSPHGYDIELVAELANRLEYNLDLKLMEWNDAVKQMQEGKADLILGCDWQDASVMDCSFTIPTFEEKFVVFELEQSDSFTELYDKKIAVIEGCGLKETLIRYQLWPNCVEYNTVTDCAYAVLNGKCDCFIAHHTIGEVCIRDFGEDGERFRGRTDIASGQMCFGIGIRGDETELIPKVNEILLAMRADGTMDRLSHKWLDRFEKDITLGEYMREHPFALFLTINLLLAVVLGFLIMNHYLVKIRMEKDRAIAAERSKSLFFSTVSHDIRTPLNAIIGFSELLRNGRRDEAELESALEAISTSGHTLLDLINDVLDLSKLEAGKTVFDPKMTDFKKVASGVIHSFDVAVSNKNVKLEENFSEIPYVFVDPNRIRQILFNLIGNSVKFTEHGKIVLSVSFEKKSDERGCFTFSVSDTGCGMAPEDLENVLKPFVQARNAGTVIGTGLGLSICSQLAERMGGKLTIQSTLGKGTTVSVVFPDIRFSVEPPVAESPAEPVKVEPSQNPAQLSKNPRILIVDDVPVNSRVIQAMLRRLEMNDTILAENGAEALEILKKDPAIDIVLTDMWMPVLDGEGLIREIRGNEQWKDLPVYAVTADVETQKTYKALGFTGILLKPVTLDRLEAIIK